MNISKLGTFEDRLVFDHIGDKGNEKGKKGIRIVESGSFSEHFILKSRFQEVNFQGKKIFVNLSSLRKFCERGNIRVPKTREEIETLLADCHDHNTTSGLTDKKNAVVAELIKVVGDENLFREQAERRRIACCFNLPRETNEPVVFNRKKVVEDEPGFRVDVVTEKPTLQPQSHCLRNTLIATSVIATATLAAFGLYNLQASNSEEGITREDIQNNFLNNLVMAQEAVTPFIHQASEKVSNMTASTLETLSPYFESAKESTVNYFQKLFAPVYPKQPMCGLVEDIIGNCTRPAFEEPCLQQAEVVTENFGNSTMTERVVKHLFGFEEAVVDDGYSFDSCAADATVTSNMSYPTDAPVTMVLRLAKQVINLVCPKQDDPANHTNMCGLEDPMGVCKA